MIYYFNIFSIYRLLYFSHIGEYMDNINLQILAFHMYCVSYIK